MGGGYGEEGRSKALLRAYRLLLGFSRDSPPPTAPPTGAVTKPSRQGRGVLLLRAAAHRDAEVGAEELSARGTAGSSEARKPRAMNLRREALGHFAKGCSD